MSQITVDINGVVSVTETIDQIDVTVSSTPVSVDVGTSGPQGATGATGAPGVTPVFTRTDTLTPYTGKARFYFDAARTITQIRAAVGTAPTGSGIVVDVLVNGSSIGNVTIPTSQYTGTLTLNRSVAANDYVTVSILSVGTTTPGTDLTVTLTIN